MAIAKALVSKIYKKSYADLNNFCSTVAVKTTGEAYEPLREDLNRMESDLSTFQAALADRENGGTSTTLELDDARKALVASTVQVGKDLTFYCNGSTTYILEAGFELHSASVTHKGELAQPIVSDLFSTGKAGQARVKIDRSALSPGWKLICGEYSVDNGATWQNGIQETKTNFLVNDLPNAKVLFRFYVTGTNSRKSLYSPSILIGIA